MVLEWLRRHDGVLDAHLRRYLFTDAPIVGIEEASEAGESSEAGSDPAGGSGMGLGIGSLRAAGR